MLRVVVAVERMRPQAMLLAMITIRKSTHGYGALLGGSSGRRSPTKKNRTFTWTFKKYVFQEFLRPGITIKLACIIYRRISGGRNLVRVRNVVVATIFDFMTVEDWGE